MSANEVENFGGWLTTIAARLCLDRLRARRSRSEQSLDSLLPEARLRIDDSPGPEQEALLGESVEFALLVVLDRLAPAERVAFVLHDVFAVPFEQIGEILGRSPESARQLASRARRRVQGTTPSGSPDLVRRREIVSAFIIAARAGDFEGLVALLDPNVALRPDTEAVRLGSFSELHGAMDVATALRGGAQAGRLALVAGMPGIAWTPGGQLRGAIALDVQAGHIVALDVIGDPEHLERLDVVILED